MKWNVLSCMFAFILVCAVAGCNRDTNVSLNLAEAEINLVMGHTHRLNAEIRPVTAEVEWSSSNPEVAFVNSEGVVTANYLGEAVIYVSCGQAMDSCLVTVIGQAAESITLDINEMSLFEGDTLQLNATVSPEDTYNRTVIWSSSDESVAVVSETGKVTALSPGEALITAAIDEVSANCAITVIDVPNVGDYYFSDGTFSHDLQDGETPLGIIFWLNEDKVSGKMVELGEASLPWGTSGYAFENYDRYDGGANTRNVLQKLHEDGLIEAFPAFEYVDSLNTAGEIDWYLPSTVELKQLYCAISGVKWVEDNPGEGEQADWPDTGMGVLVGDEWAANRDAFNARIEAAGGTILNLRGYSYWSSTSNNLDTVYQIFLHTGVGFMIIREGTNRVRAIAEF